MAEVVEVEFYPDGIEIRYSDGSKEEILAGRYELKDPNGETVVQRTATQADIERLNAIAQLAPPPTGANDDGTADQGPGDAPGTPTSGGSTNDDGTPDQGSGDVLVTATVTRAAAKTAPAKTVFDDSVTGTAGNDTINTANGDDKVRSGAGNDIINTRGGDDNIRSHAGNDRINSGSGDDDVRGGTGNDLVNGGSGNDDLHGDAGNDVIRGGIGNDKIRGDAGNDRLFGDAGNDDIEGGRGNDFLNGGAGLDKIEGGFGRDILIGGGGRDEFEFDFLSDSGLGVLRDIIRDFRQGIDLIDVSRIDAVSGAGNQEFNFIADLAFSNTAGELRYQKIGANTLIEMDVNGDGNADSQILLNGSIDLTRFDFDL